MPKKAPMSWPDHQSLGKQLKAFNKSLMEISIKLQTTYGVTSRVGRLAKKLSQGTAELRSALDEQVSKDCPDQTTSSLNRCYIGD
jgi:hypothetical protein